MPDNSAMNFIDLLIIYLACGAPFGVYYFLHRYKEENSVRLWLKTLFVSLFWIYFAVIFFIDKFKNRFSFVKSINEKRLLINQKRLEETLQKSSLNISLFDFRETLERYIGLTLAVKNELPEIARSEKEIFRISRAKNTELAAICIRRRNRKRLFTHHSQAREDFLAIIGKLFYSVSDKTALEAAAYEFVDLLSDSEARQKLKEKFAAGLQTEGISAVRLAENNLWKPVVQEPLQSKQVLTHFQTPLSATAANLRKKD